jgi:hypothetical protein
MWTCPATLILRRWCPDGSARPWFPDGGLMATRKTQERIPAKELREYLKLPVDQALSRRGDEVRILPDGRVLWTIPGVRIARTWPSREAYAEMQREFAEYAAKVSVDPCLTLLPPIDDFLRDVEAHAKSLGPRLRIPDEVLDFTPASLDAVDKALKRIPWAKRQVPDLVTPLVAYLGEVIRRGCGGRWTKMPTTTRVREVAVYDPVELAAYQATERAVTQAAAAAGYKAADEARARRASASDVAHAFSVAHGAVYKELWVAQAALKPIRTDVIEETIRDHENEPMITASPDHLFQPFASVFIPMIEPSRRIPLRSANGVPYRRPPKPGA